MRNIRANTGLFPERPYFKDEVMETICLDALRGVDLLPKEPEPIRVDRFIEKHFKVTPKYEPLEDGVLGLTVFGKEGVKDVIVSREIDETGSVASERLVRSTLAHEAGHGLFHAHLFAFADSSKPLFGDNSDPAKPKVLCRDVSADRGRKGYNGAWWEFQANRAIGALLMPRHLVEAAVEDFTTASGLLGLREFDHGRTQEAVRLLMETFNVNAPVAEIRLEQLFPASRGGQPML
jgi:hypothetical protein